MPNRPAPLVLQLCACLTLLLPDASAQTAVARQPGDQPSGDPRAPAGIVKRLTGTVTPERAGQWLAVQAGSAVQVGDTLRTGAHAAVGVTLADDTLLSAGPNAERRVSSFDFDAPRRTAVCWCRCGAARWAWSPG